MTKEIISDAEGRMKKSIEILRKDLATLRAGRATPSLLDKVMVEYYGTPTPIAQLASISIPEARMIVLQPYDKGVIAAVEKAIQKSDLGINPTNDGNVVRIAIPQLTEERRKELVKTVKKKGEGEKVAIRNIRRDAIEHIKAREKAKEITEDEQRKAVDIVQKATDKAIAEIDDIISAKEKEVMEV
jgi:ribosome recycling factor